MSNLYQNKLSKFINQIGNTQFIIELQKCCGYSEFIIIYKEQTLADLYKIISCHTSCPISNIRGLFVLSNCVNGERIHIPPSNNITINTFIRENVNNHTIVPVYPLPDKVVYRIIFDDGHSHLEENTNCMECIV
jgi:hypothetical protein